MRFRGSLSVRRGRAGGGHLKLVTQVQHLGRRQALHGDVMRRPARKVVLNKHLNLLPPSFARASVGLALCRLLEQLRRGVRVASQCPVKVDAQAPERRGGWFMFM